jgi:hypothetical protein
LFFFVFSNTLNVDNMKNVVSSKSLIIIFSFKIKERSYVYIILT